MRTVRISPKFGIISEPSSDMNELSVMGDEKNETRAVVFSKRRPS